MRQTALYLRLNGQGPGVKMRPCPFDGGTLPVFACHLAGRASGLPSVKGKRGLPRYEGQKRPAECYDPLPSQAENDGFSTFSE